MNGHSFTYELYANDAPDAETEQLLGVADPRGEERFTFTFTGDLRGKYITAVTRQRLFLDWYSEMSTSEISRAIRVD